MMTFIAGAFVGAGVTLLAMSCCVVAAEADRREERMVCENEKQMESIEQPGRTGQVPVPGLPDPGHRRPPCRH